MPAWKPLLCKGRICINKVDMLRIIPLGLFIFCSAVFDEAGILFLSAAISVSVGEVMLS